MPETLAPTAPPPSPSSAPPAAAPPPPPPASSPGSPPPSLSPSSPPPDSDHGFAALEAKFKAYEEAEKASAPKPKEPDAPKPKEPAAKPAAEPSKPKVEAPAKPAEPTRAPKELRAELDRLNTELATRNDAYSKLESKLKELETKGQDRDKVLERMQQLEKEIEARDARLRALRLEEDPKFKEQFDVPFNRAADTAKNLVERLTVFEPQVDPVTGETTVRPTRKGNYEKDFVRLYYQYRDEPTAAIEQAETQFGKAGQLVIQHIAKLHELDGERALKLSEARQKFKQMQQEDESRMATDRAQREQIWEQAKKEMSESVPDFRDPPDEKEAAEARAEGLRIFDAKPANMVQLIKKNAYIRGAVGSHFAQKVIIAKLRQQMAAKDAELEKLRNPTPPDPRRPGGTTEVSSKESWESEALRTLKH